jgi:hypothetical protein
VKLVNYRLLRLVFSGYIRLSSRSDFRRSWWSPRTGVWGLIPPHTRRAYRSIDHDWSTACASPLWLTIKNKEFILTTSVGDKNSEQARDNMLPLHCNRKMTRKHSILICYLFCWQIQLQPQRGYDIIFRQNLQFFVDVCALRSIRFECFIRKYK